MPRLTAKELNLKWNVGAQHALYRKDGKWYHLLERFPGVLFDKNGYKLFKTKADYDSCPSLLRNKRGDTNWLVAKQGISSIDGYVVYPELFLPYSEFSFDENHKPDLWEGARTRVSVNRYERNRQARDACIKLFGSACSVCRFDFSKVYGELGYGYIHVHHLTPLSEIKQGYKVDPTKDLRPVCPNCHEMLHKRNPPLEIEELTRMLKI